MTAHQIIKRVRQSCLALFLLVFGGAQGAWRPGVLLTTAFSQRSVPSNYHLTKRSDGTLELGVFYFEILEFNLRKPLNLTL